MDQVPPIEFLHETAKFKSTLDDEKALLEKKRE